MSTTTTVNFNLKTAGYSNFANQTLTFRLLTAGADGSGDYVVLPGIVTATSDANGDGSVTLFRNGVSDIESIYEVILPNREKVQFVIPSGTATVELSSLIVNNQPTSATTQQSSVYAAAIQRANHTGTQLLSTISDSSTVQLKPSEGAFANGDKTKLDGIEASADVTDTTNVTAAGALMDSEVTNLSLVKGLTGGISNGNVLLANAAVSDNDFLKIDGTSVEGRSASELLSDLGIAGSTTEEIQDIAGALVATGGTKTGITVTYDDANNNMDFVVASQTDENFTTADHAKLDSLEATAVSNFVPRSITFDDQTAFLSVADDATIDVGTGDFSLAFWARLDSSSTEGVLQKNGSTGFAVKFNSGNLILTLNDSGGSSDFTLASSLNDNKWHVYVITVDRNGNAIAYVDNVAQTGVSVSGKSGNLDNTSAFQIGIVGTDGNAGVSLGNYVALYKSVLSASSANKIYFSRDAAVSGSALAVDLRRETETFKDVATTPLTVTTNGTITFNEERLTEFTGTNVLATSTLGYTTGSGGTVTQATSKSTAVTLNKINGEIVMHDAALADDASVAFTLTNSTIAATDVVIVNVASVGTVGAYQVTVGAVAAGSCSISILNVSGGSLSQAIKLNFAVIKAVAS